MNINICLHCIIESAYSKAQPHHVRLSSLNLDLPLEVNSIDICIDSEDIESDSASDMIFFTKFTPPDFQAKSFTP